MCRSADSGGRESVDHATGVGAAPCASGKRNYPRPGRSDYWYRPPATPPSERPALTGTSVGPLCTDPHRFHCALVVGEAVALLVCLTTVTQLLVRGDPED